MRSSVTPILVLCVAALQVSCSAWLMGADDAPGSSAVTPTWKRVQGATDDLFGVSAIAPGDAWAVGAGGSIVHIEAGPTATSTVRVGTAALRAAWASGPNDVWAVGDGGAIVHKGPGAWAPDLSPVSSALYGVWGSSALDVWAVGAQGVILHRDSDAVWRVVQKDQNYTLTAIAGSGSNDIWATQSARSNMLHYTSGKWSAVPSANAFGPGAVWASTSGAVWTVCGVAVASRRNESGSWTNLARAPNYLNAVWGSDDNDVWAAGNSGTLVHSTDGQTWEDHTPTLPNNHFFALTGTGRTDVIAVGRSGLIFRYGL